MPHNQNMVEKLRRLELAHTFRGIRTRNNPGKRNYHVIMVRDCRTKIDYLLKTDRLAGQLLAMFTFKGGN